ncbi:SAM and U-box domain-containing protein 1 [Seminavis robusta]|uniref:SAM and U-box domain-containing protein 1 n=1 Tax=Seminavis robusta TaxID=568900 RepID=A0A9N8EQ63_9STRA|nr:SAM and U-box domain-containing protein 1 [Seminavis robusta]|eukprot:Sro1387_g268390.1 SAM and U-box domain-containing protein 1 (1326) ;mRNA; f:22408-26650
MEMEESLTAGAILRLAAMTSSDDDPSFQPTLQVLEIATVQSDDDEITAFVLVLSDGTHSARYMLDPCETNLIQANLLEVYGIIRLYGFEGGSCSTADCLEVMPVVRRLIVSGQNPGKSIGDPMDFNLVDHYSLSAESLQDIFRGLGDSCETFEEMALLEKLVRHGGKRLSMAQIKGLLSSDAETDIFSGLMQKFLEKKARGSPKNNQPKKDTRPATKTNSSPQANIKAPELIPISSSNGESVYVDKKELDKMTKLSPQERTAIAKAMGTETTPQTTLNPEHTVQKLPILAALTHSKVPLHPDVVAALVDEYKIRKLIAREAKKQAEKKGRSNNYFALSREYKEKERVSQETADKQISKQYRKVSLRLHPDRHGDLYQREFDELLLAYEIMKDPDFRQDYVDKMVKVIETAPDHAMPAHESYVSSYQEQKDQATEWARYQRAMVTGGHKAHFYIETHLMNQSPRALHVNNIQGKTISIALPPLNPLAHFESMCQSVSVWLESVPKGNDTVLKRLEGQALKKAFGGGGGSQPGWVQTNVALPEYGTWQIYWKAQLKVEVASDKTAETTPSVSRQVVLTDPSYERAEQRLPGLIQHAKLLRSSLQSESQKLSRSTQGMSTGELEKSYWSVHALISKSRTIASSLWGTLEKMGHDDPKDYCLELEQLLTWIDTCAREKSQLDDKIQHNQKKLSMKSFKHSVAALIEEGRLRDWILNAEKQEIINTGGEVNRLYQLITEGKKANSLLLDADSLRNAATRSDLFSTKQCQSLLERADEVEARMLEETQRLVQQHAEEDAAKKKREEMEKLALVGLRLRQKVMLKDLKTRTELNGTIGLFMGLAQQGNRFVVRVQGVDMALCRENFEEWRGGENATKKAAPKVATWTCSLCTLLNNATLDKCSVCENPRKAVSAAGTKTTTAIGKSSITSVSVKNKQTKKPAPVTQQQISSKPAPVGWPATSTGKSSSAWGVPKQHGAQVGLLASSKVPARKTIRMWFPANDASAFIGKKGSNVKKVKEATGASIMVDKKTKNNTGCCAIYLEGTATQIMDAQVAISSFIQGRKQQKENQNGASKRNGASKFAEEKKPTPQSKEIFDAGRQTPTTTSLSVPDSISIISPAPAGEEDSGLTEIMETVDKAEKKLIPKPEVPKNGTKPMDSLFLFVCQQASCLKCKPEAFYEFLRSEDITTLKDLQEGLGDDDFLQEMIEHGLKGFKKKLFSKAAADAGLLGGIATVDNGLSEPKKASTTNQPSQLHLEFECPICYELMVKDPVMASDGFTYERHAIESWFRRHKDKSEGIPSPKTNVLMTDLRLIPNIQMRSMARDFSARSRE